MTWRDLAEEYLTTAMGMDSEISRLKAKIQRKEEIRDYCQHKADECAEKARKARFKDGL